MYMYSIVPHQVWNHKVSGASSGIFVQTSRKGLNPQQSSNLQNIKVLYHSLSTAFVSSPCLVSRKYTNSKLATYVLSMHSLSIYVMSNLSSDHDVSPGAGAVARPDSRHALTPASPATTDLLGPWPRGWGHYTAETPSAVSGINTNVVNQSSYAHKSCNPTIFFHACALRMHNAHASMAGLWDYSYMNTTRYAPSVAALAVNPYTHTHELSLLSHPDRLFPHCSCPFTTSCYDQKSRKILAWGMTSNYTIVEFTYKSKEGRGAWEQDKYVITYSSPNIHSAITWTTHITISLVDHIIIVNQHIITHKHTHRDETLVLFMHIQCMHI